MIYTDEDYDTFKNISCIECEHFSICEIFDFDWIDKCMDGAELSEKEQAYKDMRCE